MLDLPISPCGHAVDFLRACYESDVRFYVDSGETTRVRWFWVSEDAPVLPFRTPFGSGSWARHKRPHSGIGEVYNPNWDGINGHGVNYPEGGPCGTEEQWAGHLTTIDKQATPLDPWGFPLCCATPDRPGPPAITAAGAGATLTGGGWHLVQVGSGLSIITDLTAGVSLTSLAGTGSSAGGSLTLLSAHGWGADLGTNAGALTWSGTSWAYVGVCGSDAGSILYAGQVLTVESDTGGGASADLTAGGQLSAAGISGGAGGAGLAEGGQASAAGVSGAAGGATLFFTGNTVVSPCCPDVAVPATLTVRFSQGTMDYAQLIGVSVDLVYDPVHDGWYPTGNLLWDCLEGGQFGPLRFYCDGAHWRMALAGCASFDAPATSYTCDPFYVIGSADVDGHGHVVWEIGDAPAVLTATAVLGRLVLGRSPLGR